MSAPFFPGLVFAWCFVSTLALLLAVASVIDLRRMVVPKWLTLTALPVGLAFNISRGAWLGGQGQSVWALGAHGLAAGAVDGLLFALAGFVVGFAAFFLMWVLRICGGGDVKLYAVVGAWIGAYLAFLVLVLLMVVLLAVTVGQLLGRLRQGRSFVPAAVPRGPQRLPTGLLPTKRPRRLLTFSLPLALSTIVVLLWSFRVDLRLTSRPQVARAAVERHDS